MTTIDNIDHPGHGLDMIEVDEDLRKRDFRPKLTTLTSDIVLAKAGIDPAETNKETFRPIGTIPHVPPTARESALSGVRLPSQFSYTEVLLRTRSEDAAVARSRYIQDIIRDQGDCGSCYAFSISEMIMDRVAIRTRGEFAPLLSPASLMCKRLPGMDGCQGGVPYHALQKIHGEGMLLEKTFPYKPTESICFGLSAAEDRAGESTDPGADGRVFVSEPSMVTACRSGDLACWIRQATGQEQMPESVREDNIRKMKEAILQRGPIVVAMMVYSDFSNLTCDTPYKKASGAVQKGGHAIECVGWDDDLHGVPHWICRNSWGEKFPVGNCHQPGFFYIQMHTNEVGIEGYAVEADPDFSRGILAARKVKDYGVDVKEAISRDAESRRGGGAGGILPRMSRTGVIVTLGILAVVVALVMYSRKK